MAKICIAYAHLQMCNYPKPINKPFKVEKLKSHSSQLGHLDAQVFSGKGQCRGRYFSTIYLFLFLCFFCHQPELLEEKLLATVKFFFK